MIKADYHTHSRFSPDSAERVEDMARAARNAGLNEICLTDHIDFWPATGEWRTPPNSEEARLDAAAAEKTYPGVKIKVGVEIGLSVHEADEIKEFAEKGGFDFIIGSIHYVEKFNIFHAEFYEKATKERAYGDYLEYMLKCVQTIDAYDVIGHFDVMARWSPYADKSFNPALYTETIDEILKTLVSKGKGLEINTAALNYDLKHVHPHPAVLRRFKELGGEIVTVGSDAHQSRVIGRYFAEAREALLDAGFTRYAVFSNRAPTFRDIE